MIEHGTIERVIEAAQIVEVVSDFVSLKKRGMNYIGNCPFHQEKTPSFMVSPAKGIFKCFGCGKAGNSVHFIMEHEHLSYIETIKYLGNKFHIPIQEKELSPEHQKQKNERESMLIVSGWAQKFFETQMFETVEGKSIALGYFRERGFRDDIIRKFQLGYSPEQRDGFTQAAQKAGYQLEYLVKTGLTVQGDNYVADRFRGRVMFPIHGVGGKVIGFGGRVMKTDAKTAKYLNSPESEIYHKGSVLYGLYFAKNEITKQDRCYLVEGYTDVISMHQSGIQNVVASSGTALTVEQIKLIMRFTKNITFIFDGDAAGIKASFRGIDLVLEEGANIKVIPLPDGEDPDSFSKSRSAGELSEYLQNNEIDFIKFKTQILSVDTKNDPIKRAQLIQDIVRTISVIPDMIVRSIYIKECGSLLGVEEEFLYAEIKKISKDKQEKQFQRTSANAEQEAQVQQTAAVVSATHAASNPFETEEREVLRYLLKFGKMPLSEHNEVTVAEYIIGQIREDEMVFQKEVYNRILEIYEANLGVEAFDAEKSFIFSSDMEISQVASELFSEKHILSKIHERFSKVVTEEEILFELVPKVIYEYKFQVVKFMHAQRMAQMKIAAEKGDQDAIMVEMNACHQLQMVLQALSKELGKTIY